MATQKTFPTSALAVEVVAETKEEQVKLGLISCLLCCTSIAMASPTNGTLLAVRDLEPKRGVIYSATLKGGENTSIDVTGTNAGGDLDCELLFGVDVIAEDKDHKVDACHMKVAIKTTGEYKLIVVNHGSSKTRLTMMLQ